MLDLKKVREYFEDLHTSIEPSSISFSPYDYLYIFLTEHEDMGPHLIISDAEEMGEKGVYLGVYSTIGSEGKVYLMNNVHDTVLKAEEIMQAVKESRAAS